MMIYTIDEIKKKIKPLAEKHGLAAVYLFGSYARGEAKHESDIDLMIDRSGSEIKGLLRLSSFHHELEAALDKSVDLIDRDVSKDETVQQRRPLFVNHIMGERVRIYGA